MMPTLAALTGFIAWTLFLLVLMESIRAGLVMRGRVPSNGFQPDNGNPMYRTVIDKDIVAVATDKKIIKLLEDAAKAKEPALSIHISGVSIKKRRSMPNDKASCMAFMVSSRQSG